MVGKGAMMLAMFGLMTCQTRPNAGVQTRLHVRPGIEVLLEDSGQLVRGRRVGLVSNQAGVDHRGVSDVELLRAAGVNLVALFSPEHGFRGSADPGAEIAFSRDSATGLPIYSLYGRVVAPTEAMLADLDVLLVDLQDVGARYYTYLATTVEVMRSAGRFGRTVVVLDRPNPIGGAVQGNILDPAFSSFVGRLAIPMRHGMTLAELALLARADLGLTTDLRIVPASGWRRSDYFDQTGLPFVPPSPNLRDLESLFHYPGTCLFEGTALSVGRGSEAAYRQIGAPWLDTASVLERIHALNLPGVSFQSVRFTPVRPADRKFPDTTVAGIRLTVTDRARYNPTRTAVALLAVVNQVHPDRIGFRPKEFDRLAGGQTLRLALERGEKPQRMGDQWARELQAFIDRARPYRFYPE